MEVKPGYKRTEIGVIPNEWEANAGNAVGVLGNSGTHLKRMGAVWK